MKHILFLFFCFSFLFVWSNDGKVEHTLIYTSGKLALRVPTDSIGDIAIVSKHMVRVYDKQNTLLLSSLDAKVDSVTWADYEIVKKWKPLFVGHRGCYTGVMNTAEAFRNGVEKYGYDGLECDVRVTRDGQYVISHDETTNAVGGSLTVANATLAELKAEKYTQTRGGITYSGGICTVAEYLAICKEKNVIPVIELKWTTGINNNDMSKYAGLYNLVKSYGLLSKAVFLTSMKSSLEYIRTHFPDAKCQFLTGQYWANHFDWCVQWKISPSIQTGYFDADTVKKFHDAGLEVAMWTVNSESNYVKYGKMGVSMMTCDYLYADEMPELEPMEW